MDSTPQLLVIKYKTAWEQHDIRLLAEIFTEDIVYQEKPGVILRGLPELEQYWLDNKEKQRNVIFTAHQCTASGNDIELLWSASFFDTKKKMQASIQGTMWLRLDGKKIGSLKESFNIVYNEPSL